MPYCSNCGNEIAIDMVYCPNCGNKPDIQVDKQLTGKTVDLPSSTEPIRTQMGLNWFQRHLNWITFISLVIIYPLAFIIGFLGAYINPYMSSTTLVIIAYIICGIWLFGINGWVLRRKNRSLGFLLLFVIPFGWIAFFFVENKSDMLTRNTL